MGYIIGAIGLTLSATGVWLILASARHTTPARLEEEWQDGFESGIEYAKLHVGEITKKLDEQIATIERRNEEWPERRREIEENC